MKHLLLTTIAAVVLVGCGESQQSVPPAETEPAEPVAEAAKPELPTAKVPYISIHFATAEGNIKAVIRHLANGVDVNVKNDFGFTPLLKAAQFGRREVAELLIAKGADVNAKNDEDGTPLHLAADRGHTEVVELLITAGADVNAKDDEGETPLDQAGTSWPESADLLRKHGGKTGEELKAEGK